LVMQFKFQSRFRSLLRASKRCAREERGGTLVEFGFSLLFMFGFILGIMQLSMAMYAYHCVSDAARDGTRYAIVRGYDWGTSCDSNANGQGNPAGDGSGSANSGCVASLKDIQNYVENAGFLNGSTNMTVTPQCASVIGGTFTTYSPSTTCNAATDVVKVTVSYPFSFGIPGFPRYTYQLSSTSQEVISY